MIYEQEQESLRRRCDELSSDLKIEYNEEEEAQCETNIFEEQHERCKQAIPITNIM